MGMRQRIARGAGAMLQEALLPMRTRAARAIGLASTSPPQKSQSARSGGSSVSPQGRSARSGGSTVSPQGQSARSGGPTDSTARPETRKKDAPGKKWICGPDFLDRRFTHDLSYHLKLVRVLPGRRISRPHTGRSSLLHLSKP